MYMVIPKIKGNWHEDKDLISEISVLEERLSSMMDLFEGIIPDLKESRIVLEGERVNSDFPGD